MFSQSSQESLKSHLALWGLRRFTSDEQYFAWQRQVLSSRDVDRLHELVALKRRGTAADEAAFYDATADVKFLPVLYSQRYDYYCAVAPRVSACLNHARSVLDFGCGIGILTLFYARQHPDKEFVGLDRSPLSIARANEAAAALRLCNVRFERCDVTQQPCSGSYDAIIATHALVQAEQDPGLPSRDWTTFERADDPQQQQAFEERTGIAARFAALCGALAPCGRLIICEKTRQLGRRIAFQRAMGARGLEPFMQPEPIQYALVEEVVADGPLYVLARGPRAGSTWDEAPEPDQGRPYDPALLPNGTGESHHPLYENHWPSAQGVWAGLEGKQVLRQTTRQEPDGRQFHVELGTAGGLLYLYCANTFDQRQLVLMRVQQRGHLEQYYREIVEAV